MFGGCDGLPFYLKPHKMIMETLRIKKMMFFLSFSWLLRHYQAYFSISYHSHNGVIVINSKFYLTIYNYLFNSSVSIIYKICFISRKLYRCTRVFICCLCGWDNKYLNLRSRLDRIPVFTIFIFTTVSLQ